MNPLQVPRHNKLNWLDIEHDWALWSVFETAEEAKDAAELCVCVCVRVVSGGWAGHTTNGTRVSGREMVHSIETEFVYSDYLKGNFQNY